MKIYVVLETYDDVVREIRAFLTQEEADVYVKGMGGESPNLSTEDTYLEVLEVEVTTPEASKNLIEERVECLEARVKGRGHQLVKSKLSKKLTKTQEAILSHVHVPPVCVEVNTSDKSQMSGAHFDELMQMPFTDKYDAASKLRNLATLLASSLGTPDGGGTIYVGLRKK